MTTDHLQHIGTPSGTLRDEKLAVEMTARTTDTSRLCLQEPTMAAALSSRDLFDHLDLDLVFQTETVSPLHRCYTLSAVFNEKKDPRP